MQDVVLLCDSVGFCEHCKKRGDETKVKFLWSLNEDGNFVPENKEAKMRGYFCSYGHLWIEIMPPETANSGLQKGVSPSPSHEASIAKIIKMPAGLNMSKVPGVTVGDSAKIKPSTGSELINVVIPVKLSVDTEAASSNLDTDTKRKPVKPSTGRERTGI
jgi:hypothetical protein